MKQWLGWLSLGCCLAVGAVEPVIDANGYMVNVDEVLATPPANEVKVGMVNGALGVILNGEPLGSCGFSSILQRNLSDQDIADLMERTGFRINYINVCLGEEMVYGHGLNYGSTWLDDRVFDWQPIDRELARVKAHAPNTKIILKIDMNGAKWWTKKYPDSAADVASGQADYLSARWKEDARMAIRQMVAHIQTGPYADMVIGYTLFNGNTLDCSWAMNPDTPAMVAGFRAFLRAKYPTEAALQAAWQDTGVTFENATVVWTRDERLPDSFPLLHSQAEQARLGDSREFINYAWQELIVDFARNVKEATQNRAIVGARTGNLLYGQWEGAPLQGGRGGFGYAGDFGSEAVNRLLASPDLDYFDQWSNYFGRFIGVSDHGGPVMPTKGLEKFNKMVWLQNDIPTHVNTEPGYGATADLNDTIAMQRRIFAHALTKEMYPYLWQMSSNFNVPELMPEYQKMEQIFRKSLQLERSSEATIAFVVDGDLAKNLGKDFEVKHPSRGVALLDYPRLEWGRAGVGFDMIYLEQLEHAADYPVYVFFHTIRLDDAAIAKIHRKLAQTNSIGVFVWADGFLDGAGKFSIENMNKLTGMTLEVSDTPDTWEMLYTEELRKLGFGRYASHRHRRLGLSEFMEPSDWTLGAKVFPPYIRVADPEAVIWGTHYDNQVPLLAMKKLPEWTSVYSASPILVPELLQVIVRQAGAFQYLNSDDALYLNKSFIGVHTRPETRQIELNFPEATALFDVFNAIEYPAALQHKIKVEGRSTYLFFRGNQETWESL